MISKKTCSNFYKHRNCCLFHVLHHGDYAVLPHTNRYIEQCFMYIWGITKDSSHTWWYIGRPLSDGCAWENTNMDLSSHVPWVYWETLLGTCNQLRKSTCLFCWRNTMRKSLGDILRTYHPSSQVFRKGYGPNSINHWELWFKIPP